MKLLSLPAPAGPEKSTMKDNLAARLDKGHYACVDSDETGRNWRDYVGTEQKAQ